jgi:hypothetical protein
VVGKTKYDPFGPQGDIAKARAALLAFAPQRKPRLSRSPSRGLGRHLFMSQPLPVGWKLRAPLDGALLRVATLYNRALAEWEQQPRLAEMITRLEKLRRAANAYAAALSDLDKITLVSLLQDALVLAERERKSGARDPVPFDMIAPPDLPPGDVIKAFAPEILARVLWIDAPDFIGPSIARAKAVARLAVDACDGLAYFGRDKGGRGGALARLMTQSPKEQLVFDCAMMIYACFDDEDVERISSTPHRPSAATSERPRFEAFVAEMHAYAVGSDSPENFERALKAGIARFKREWPEFRGRYGFDYWPAKEPGTSGATASIDPGLI